MECRDLQHNSSNNSDVHSCSPRNGNQKAIDESKAQGRRRWRPDTNARECSSPIGMSEGSEMCLACQCPGRMAVCCHCDQRLCDNCRSSHMDQVFAMTSSHICQMHKWTHKQGHYNTYFRNKLDQTPLRRDCHLVLSNQNTLMWLDVLRLEQFSQFGWA